MMMGSAGISRTHQALWKEQFRARGVRPIPAEPLMLQAKMKSDGEIDGPSRSVTLTTA
jgi:hypothetical protein